MTISEGFRGWAKAPATLAILALLANVPYMASAREVADAGREASGAAGAGIAGATGSVSGAIRIAQSVGGGGTGTGGSTGGGSGPGTGAGGGGGPGPSGGTGVGHGGGMQNMVLAPGADDASTSCGASQSLPDPSAYSDPADAVKAISNATQQYIERCKCVTQSCIADALDRYAEALAVVAPRLAPRLRNLPAIVARAARGVRAAKSKAAAVRILNVALKKVEKEVDLVKVENPDQLPTETRAADFVAGTMEKAALSLERAAAL